MWPSELLSRDRTARRALVLSMICGALASIAFALWTIQLAWVIAAVFIDGDSLSDRMSSFVVLALLAASQAIALRLRRPLAQRASNHYRSGLRQELLGLALRGSTGTDHAPSAQQHAIIGEAVESLDEYITQFLPALALAAIVPTLILGLIAMLDPWTTLVLLFAGPLLITLLAVIGRRTRDLAAARFQELSWLGSLYADLLSGLATLKIFGREGDALEAVTETSTNFGRSTMKVLRTAFQTSLVIEWAATASTALVAVEVSFRLVDRQLPFATALAVLMLTPEFFSPLRKLAADYHAGQTGAAALTSIRAATDALQSPADSAPNLSPFGAENPPKAMRPSPPPAITFDAMLVSHPARAEGALHELSATIAPGETVALLGPSGCGKTTATMALLGFEQPDAGEVRVDGVDVRSLDLDVWRARVAWVPQNPTIFSGTIADNIKLGRPDATPDQVEAAARVAAIHHVIAELPDGYSTMVGAQGTRLSGGQRQRIALARAVLLDRPVMILDEFTAHLDPATEEQVLDALAPVLRDRTVLLISHRSSPLRLADRIIALANPSRQQSEP